MEVKSRPLNWQFYGDDVKEIWPSAFQDEL